MSSITAKLICPPGCTPVWDQTLEMVTTEFGVDWNWPKAKETKQENIPGRMVNRRTVAVRFQDDICAILWEALLFRNDAFASGGLQKAAKIGPTLSVKE